MIDQPTPFWRPTFAATLEPSKKIPFGSKTRPFGSKKIPFGKRLHSHGKITILRGQFTTNVPFSIALLVYRMVHTLVPKLGHAELVNITPSSLGFMNVYARYGYV